MADIRGSSYELCLEAETGTEQAQPKRGQCSLMQVTQVVGEWVAVLSDQSAPVIRDENGLLFVRKSWYPHLQLDGIRSAECRRSELRFPDTSVQTRRIWVGTDVSEQWSINLSIIGVCTLPVPVNKSLRWLLFLLLIHSQTLF